MFKRLKDSADAADGTRPSSPERDRAEAGIESLLRRLDEAAKANGDDDSVSLRRIAEEVEEHAEVLSATVSARQEAQNLLALAMTERDKASADGAAVIEEARGMAVRLMREAEAHAKDSLAEVRRWAAEQRSDVEQTVAELVDAAQQEADEVRADAHEHAMGEATLAAQVYVSRAAALATRDAERHRDDAAVVLDRTAEAVAAARTTVEGFTESVAAFMTSMSGHLDTLQELVDQAEGHRSAAAALEPISVDPESWEATGLPDDEDLVLLPLDPGGRTAPASTPRRTSRAAAERPAPEPVDEVVDGEEPTDTDDETVTDTDADADTDADDAVAVDATDVADDPQAEVEADEVEAADDDAPAEDAAPSKAAKPKPKPKSPARPRTGGTTRTRPQTPPPGGRPLGSMFRDRD